MSIKNIAAAMIAPAAIAGVALSTGAAANAATVHNNAATVHNAAKNKYQPVGHCSFRRHSQQIAAAHHMSWEALYVAPPNRSRIHDPNLVTVGERLRIPADPELWASKFVAPRTPAEPAPRRLQLRHPRLRDQRLRDPRLQGSAAVGSTAQGPTGQAPVQPAGGATLSSGGGSSFQRCVRGGKAETMPPRPTGYTGSCRQRGRRSAIQGRPARRQRPSRMPRSTSSTPRDGAQPWAPYDGC